MQHLTIDPMRLFSQSLIWLGIVSLSVLATKPATAETKTAVSGNVRVEISYEQPEEYQFKNVRVKIIRAGQILLDRQMPQESEYDRPVASIADENALPVVDLDGDKEPEIIADFYTGGAHCCTYSLIYRYNSAQNSYTSIRHDWGNVGYRLKDLNQDGLPEFDSLDDRFAYAFSSYAGSGFPLQIWQYRQGEMANVTRRYPQLIKNHAYQVWQGYTQARKEDYEVKGFLTAYLADKYLLGQGQDGWQRVEQAYRESDRAQYFSELRRFLRETGYVQ